MMAQLQQVLADARALSASEKLELLEAITHDLRQAYDFNQANAQFWISWSLEAIAALQGTPVVTNINDLGADDWPDDETADDINDYVAAQRHAERLSDLYLEA